MIDVHAHVLAGLDDGAPTFEESLAMVRMAAEAGTTDLVATPHANLQFRYDPELIERKLRELAEASGNAVKLYRGCDFHLYFDNIQDALAHPTRYTIDQKSYLLVEFPDLLIAKTTGEIFARLLDAGMIPIITHPERNALLIARLEQLRTWVGQGCLIQVTAQSFLGRFGSEARNFARALMQEGLVHVVASDAHDARDRTPRLDEAYRHVARRWGEARSELLFQANPRAVVAGEPLPEQGPPELARPRPWYRFWR